MDNQQLYEKALNAITELFNDKSVSISDALKNMKNLCDEINIFIDLLERDMERDDGQTE